MADFAINAPRRFLQCPKGSGFPTILCGKATETAVLLIHMYVGFFLTKLTFWSTDVIYIYFESLLIPCTPNALKTEWKYFYTWRLSPPERNARFLKCIQIYRCKHFVLKQFFCFAAAMVVKMRAQMTDQMTMRKRKTDSFCIWQQDAWRIIALFWRKFRDTDKS